MMRKTDLEILREVLDLDDAEAVEALELCRWADHQQTIRAHGYPRDNVIPDPMLERLARPTYLRDMLDAADDEETPEAVLEAIRSRLDELADD